jgi:hypothetical protein
MLTLLQKTYEWLADVEPLPADEKVAFEVPAALPIHSGWFPRRWLPVRGIRAVRG